MRDLLSNLAQSLRAAHRTNDEYGSMLDVVAGRNALRLGQLILARQYFERAIPIFEKLATESEDDVAALSDLMSANACLIDTLQRLGESAGAVDASYAGELNHALQLQSSITLKLEMLAAANAPKIFANRA
jgi:hypothetical protein